MDEVPAGLSLQEAETARSYTHHEYANSFSLGLSREWGN